MNSKTPDSSTEMNPPASENGATGANATGPAGRRRGWLPQLKSRWWSVVLGLSLMLNLLVGGLALGHYVRGGPMERMANASQVQLIPRRFFGELPDERRKELTSLLRAKGDEFRELRQAARNAGLRLADELDREPFSIEDVRATVNEFSTGAHSLAASGGAVVVEIISRLTPVERKALAEEIRRRGARGKPGKTKQGN